MNDTLKQYLQEVKKLLPCSSSEKKRCIIELESDVSAFLENNPNATLEDLYASIGSPESIAKSFSSRISPTQLSHRLSIKRKIAIGVIVIVALLAIVVGIVAIKIGNDVHEIQNGHIAEYIEDSSAAPLPTSQIEVH